MPVHSLARSANRNDSHPIAGKRDKAMPHKTQTANDQTVKETLFRPLDVRTTCSRGWKAKQKRTTNLQNLISKQTTKFQTRKRKIMKPKSN